MNYLGDFRLGDTVNFKFTSRRFTTGVPFTLAGAPAVVAYVSNNTTEITAGVSLTVDFDARTGLNHVSVVASSGNGFNTGTDVQVVISAGTVDGVSVVGEVVGSFSIENRSALRAATAARQLNVSAAGLADADVKATNGDATSAANVAKTQRAIGRGVVAGASTASSVTTSAMVPAGVALDQFKGRIMTFDADTTTTALRGQSTIITGSSAAASPTFTVETLTTAPVAGDTFSVT